MHLTELSNFAYVPTLTVSCRLSLVLLVATSLLAGCSADRLWKSVDPLGYSRAKDAPFLYRKDAQQPLQLDHAARRSYHLSDP